MRYKISISVLVILLSAGLFAQQPDQHIRIVDTLTAKERSGRVPVILRAELDSLIKAYGPVQVKDPVNTPVTNDSNSLFQYTPLGILVIVSMLGFVIYLFYDQRKRMKKITGEWNERLKPALSENGQYASGRDKKGKPSPQALETKISELNAELYKLSKENESLNRVIKEYNGIQHEYDSLKHGILKSYKVKNYPGYDKTKNEVIAFQGVLDTENSVAAYAYEKFLKPILSIADSNKNNPAKINDADREKLLDLLISLSFLYIEYLYLRVGDLSVGGKMVERIKGLTNSRGIDDSLLRKLNTEFGSRALVIKMTLSKAGLQNLSYPVFDETNLNNQ